MVQPAVSQERPAPEGRTSTVGVWLLPLLVLVAGGLVAALPLPVNVRLAVGASAVLAAALLAWVEYRRVQALDRVYREQAAEREAIRRQFAVQEAETVRLARELLPAAVSRLQQGAVAEEALSGLSPGAGLSRELGSAHEAVLTSVINAVEAQESLHDSAQRAFVNIARRVQAIVHQQAQDLREMQDKHGHNHEFFTDLLVLDHGNALVGRLADSVAVLAGARSGRQWRQNVPLFNVLRGAMSRIKEYERVELHSVAEFAVTGPAVEPLIHALAELLDNATRYSPPQTRVHLTAAEVQSGVAIEIEDAGVGLTEEARQRAESALAQASAGLDLDDLGETPRLGLAVVGRLASANNFTVGLRPSTYGGVRAVLTVSSDMVTVTPVPGGQIARAATLPPPRQLKVREPEQVEVAVEQAPAEVHRGPNGLPQRQRRRGNAPPPVARDVTEQATGAAVQPGMWLAAFQDGVSGKVTATDTGQQTGDSASGKDE